MSHLGPIAGVALTPEGDVFTAAYDVDALLWRVSDTLAPIERHRVATKNVNGAAASPCGRWLATGSSDGAAALIDRGSGRVLSLDHPGDVEAVAFSDDGSRLASGGTDGMVRVFATDDGVLLGVLPHGKTVAAVRFLPSGELLTVCNDGALRCWTPDLSLAWKLLLSPLPLKSLAVVGGHAFVGGHDTTLRSIDLVTRSHDVVFRLSTTPKALTAHGPLLALAAYDDTVRVADLGDWRGGDLPFVTIARDSRVWSHGIDLRGDLLAAGSFDGAPHVWRRVPTGWVRIAGPLAPVPCISSATFAGDRVVTAGDSGVVWDQDRVVASLGEAVTSIRCFGVPILGRGVPPRNAPRDTLVATTWSGNVHLLDGGTRRVVRVADGPIVCGEVTDDALFVGLYTGGVASLSLPTGDVRWRSTDAIGAVKAVHAQGDLVAVVGRYDPLRILDRETGRTLARLALCTSVSDAVRFSPTGELLACAAGDGEVWFVRIVREDAAVSLEVVGKSPGHDRPIKAVEWVSPGVVLAGDYAGRVLRHTASGPSEQVGAASPLLGVSALLVRDRSIITTTFDGHVTSFLLLRSAA